MTLDMAFPRLCVASFLFIPALAGCQVSVGGGGLDYPKLERLITDGLNKSFEPVSQKVSSVECPREPKPKTGDTFVCNADVDGNKVRVEVTVTNDDGNVDYKSLDLLVDREQTAKVVARDISKDRGFTVRVDCGDGLTVVENGGSFNCSAADPQGATRTVKVTPSQTGDKPRWVIVGE